ncbi:TniQ family protein [Rhizobium sp. Rhizsp42]|uniref:TniQ family protein n=1 Tax=Rhizobium sp. Rhizsp42 TaxID=3243034 RepID=UPI0039B0C40D
MAGILQVPLFPDETLPSWVARLARANGKLSTFSFCGDIGVDFAGFLLGRSTEIEGLATLTGRTSRELSAHALIFGAGHYVSIANETISKKFMRKNQLAFCPKCFAADDVGNHGMTDTRRYWRKSWLMNEARACTLHGCRIETLPPHSRLHDLCQVLDRNSLVVAAHVNAPVRAEVSSLDTFIVERLAGDVSHGAILDKMPLGAAIHAARLLGVALAHGAEQAVTQLSDHDVASATARGMEVLKSGASGLNAALDTIVSPGATGLYSAYGKLANLLIYNTGDDYQVVKDLVLDHASKRFMLKPGKMRGNNKTWTSATEIARITGSTKGKVQTRLYQSGVTTSLSSEVVPVNAVLDILNDDPDDMVKAKTACEIIGCDKDMFDSLVEAGLVKNAYRSVAERSKKRKFQGTFRRSDLLAFRKAVENRAGSHSANEMITLRLAARRSGISKANIIAGILSGAYTNVALSGKPLMADNVMIDFRQLDPPGDFVTALQAARLLDIRTDTVAKLLANGVICCREVSGLNQRFRRKMISRADIAAFVGRYVSIGQLVKETGLDRNVINARMRSRDIRSAFSPSEFRTAFMLRADVVRLLQETL